MIYRIGDKRVTLWGDGHFIAPNATVVGSVTLQSNVSIWFNAVLRAEGERIEIGEGSNIQDAAVLHVDPGFPLQIGRNVTVGHKAMLHGCSIGDGSLIGINAVVLNGAKIGRGSLIGANALVPENMEIPDGSLVIGSPGRISRTLDDEARAALRFSAEHYVSNAARYLDALEEDVRGEFE